MYTGGLHLQTGADKNETTLLYKWAVNPAKGSN